MQKKKTPKTKKPASSMTRGKRKESVARASVRKGTGIVRINSMRLTAIDNPFVREIVSEPMHLSGDLAGKVDIDVAVHGGGQMGSAQAVRVAIARGLVAFSGDPLLKEKFIKIDRFLLSEDSRRVEPKKYKGPKARARFQKSYR